MIDTTRDFYVEHIENSEHNKVLILVGMTIFAIGILILRHFTIDGTLLIKPLV